MSKRLWENHTSKMPQSQCIPYQTMNSTKMFSSSILHLCKQQHSPAIVELEREAPSRSSLSRLCHTHHKVLMTWFPTYPGTATPSEIPSSQCTSGHMDLSTGHYAWYTISTCWINECIIKCEMQGGIAKRKEQQKRWIFLFRKHQTAVNQLSV